MSLVRFYDDPAKAPVFALYGDAGDHESILRLISGWHETPDERTGYTERAVGDGAHDVPESDIDYAMRIPEFDYRLLARSRDDLHRVRDSMLAMAHRNITVRVTDALEDTFAVGSVKITKDKEGQNPARQTETGTIMVSCARPERLSWSPFQSQLFPVSRVAGALSYGADGKGLSYGPDGKGLTYGVAAGDQRNIGLLVNNGTSRAYPVLTVMGDFPDGVTLSVDGRTLRYEGRVGATPLILDSRSGTASMGGVDVGRQLTGRAFPIIPAGGSTSIVLLSSGSGWVTCISRDTYI